MFNLGIKVNTSIVRMVWKRKTMDDFNLIVYPIKWNYLWLAFVHKTINFNTVFILSFSFWSEQLLLSWYMHFRTIWVRLFSLNLCYTITASQKKTCICAVLRFWSIIEQTANSNNHLNYFLVEFNYFALPPKNNHYYYYYWSVYSHFTWSKIFYIALLKWIYYYE